MKCDKTVNADNFCDGIHYELQVIDKVIKSHNLCEWRLNGGEA